VVKKGIADQSQVLLMFHGDMVYDRLTRHRLHSMVDVLNIKLREELREEMGGVYSVSAQPDISELPEPTYQVSVNFTCDPQRVDELVEAVLEQIDQMKEEGASADDLGKIKEQQRRSRETQKETNSFWVSVLDFYYTRPDEDLLDVLTYEEMIESLTTEDIQQAAMRYFDEGRFVRAVLMPEAPENAGASSSSGSSGR